MLVGLHRACASGANFSWPSAPSALTLILLIFCEVAPKTFGALHPERLALPAAYIYTPLLYVLYPFVWATNLLANGVLRLFGVSQQQASHSLSSEELRTVVAEAGAMIPHRHQQMLVSILDLEKRHGRGHHGAAHRDRRHRRRRRLGRDVWSSCARASTRGCRSTKGEIDRIIGVLHMKRVVHELVRGKLERADARSTRRARATRTSCPPAPR